MSGLGSTSGFPSPRAQNALPPFKDFLRNVGLPWTIHHGERRKVAGSEPKRDGKRPKRPIGIHEDWQHAFDAVRVIVAEQEGGDEQHAQKYRNHQELWTRLQKTTFVTHFTLLGCYVHQQATETPIQ